MNVKVNLLTQNVIERGEILSSEIGCVILKEITTEQPRQLDGYELGYRWTNYIAQGIRIKEWIYNKGEEQVIKWAWLHDYAIRIVVPKWLITQMREILIFKSYFEVMGLPIEILPDEIHLYCNEILENDIDTVENLKPYGVKVEER